jgi:two-component system alkaline phosphatase synthesis response regulator PhoP
MANEKILIVDDDRDIRIGLSARLRKSGYQTVFAEDGVGAIAVARREKPELILLDIGIPAGDGFVVLDRLRDNPELMHVPVIVLTARDPARSEKKSLELGAVAFFQKPADNEKLLEAIAHHMPA